MQRHRSFLRAHQDALADPGHRDGLARDLAVVEGDVDSLEARHGEVAEPHHHLGAVLDFCGGQCLDECRAMVDVLLLAVEIVAEEVAAAGHKDVPLLDEQPQRVLEL